MLSNKVLKINHYKQTRGLSSCGSVSLKIVFEYYGKKLSEKELIKRTKAFPGKGVSHKNMIKTARALGFKVSEKNKASIKDIKRFINENIPAIVNYINPRTKKGHYSVVRGYNNKSHIIIMADSSNGDNFKISEKDFLKAWHNSKNTSKKWMLIVKK